MRITINIFYLAVLYLMAGCSQSEPLPEPQEENPTEDLCFPPFSTDTSSVQMYMTLNNVFYKPLGNFSCIVPNFFLGVNQLWINGSTPPALKVVTLMIPPDIQPGSYAFSTNSLYDARYVPADDLNFLVDVGTLTITVHDQANHHIEGGFEFHATCLSCPSQPVVEVKSGCFWADY